MKIRKLLPAVLLLTIGFSGCYRRVCAVIPVPPEDSRTPLFSLPLDKQGIADLTDWLRYGLNPNNKRDHVGVNENAAKEYGSRLDLLTKPESLQDLTLPAFKAWFHNPPLKQVVDARAKVTPSDLTAPVAANDGTYWWIFYPNGDHLVSLMVAKVNACENLKEAKR